MSNETSNQTHTIVQQTVKRNEQAEPCPPMTSKDFYVFSAEDDIRIRASSKDGITPVSVVEEYSENKPVTEPDPAKERPAQAK